ncbi:hypothetical protein T05_7556 [Trichinella murrelli]|uniref:Uncharacterized protein n=1 Tax=Trichinella murrelli TaxID=144512 RepID=A0A0V0SVV1_9BILA|nr:hypothetical protein T05_7556 [Trichinella murrelli]
MSSAICSTRRPCFRFFFSSLFISIMVTERRK